MNTAQPIRKVKDLQRLKAYYRTQVPHLRNELLIVMGLNTALRISDMLLLQWDMVYDFEQKIFHTHMVLVEQKTKKTTRIYINQSIRKVLEAYQAEQNRKKAPISPKDYLFRHRNKNVPISRVQAFRIIKAAAEECGLTGIVCCHSLRKTFGYHAWKQGASPVLLMNVYNHSSYQITKRYLGIEQDDRDQLFKQIHL